MTDQTHNPRTDTDDIDGQPVTINLMLGEVKRLALLVSGAVVADPGNAATMRLLLALQTQGGREQDRLRGEGHR